MKPIQKTGNKTFPIRLAVAGFFRKLGSKIRDLFEPEEVEVTFERKGKNITYTYTKVDRKQVA